MSDTGDVIHGTIQEVLSRLDALAGKLGIAAEQIWKFTVTAKIVEAKRDFAKSAAMILLAFVFVGWAIHVAAMNLPHEIVSEVDMESTNTPTPCTQFWNDGIKGHTPKPLAGTCLASTQKPIEIKRDHGLSQNAYAYIISGVLFALASLFVLGLAVAGMINAAAATKTAEYDAFQDLLYNLKP